VIQALEAARLPRRTGRRGSRADADVGAVLGWRFRSLDWRPASSYIDMLGVQTFVDICDGPGEQEWSPPLLRTNLLRNMAEKAQAVSTRIEAAKRFGPLQIRVCKPRGNATRYDRPTGSSIACEPKKYLGDADAKHQAERKPISTNCHGRYHLVHVLIGVVEEASLDIGVDVAFFPTLCRKAMTVLASFSIQRESNSQSRRQPPPTAFLGTMPRNVGSLY